MALSSRVPTTNQYSFITSSSSDFSLPPHTTFYKANNVLNDVHKSLDFYILKHPAFHSYLIRPSSQYFSSTCQKSTSHLLTSMFLTPHIICNSVAKCTAETNAAPGPAQWYRNLPCCSKHTKDNHIPSQGAPRTQRIITFLHKVHQNELRVTHLANYYAIPNKY